MCEIQILYPFKRTVNEEDIEEFYNLLELGSYGNKDAYGVFSDKYMFRNGVAFYDENKKNKKKIAKSLLKTEANFLVGHNRLTTQGSGKINHNNHPFPTDDWVIVHNGVISNDKELQKEHDVEYKEDTDSVIIVNLLQKFYEETGDAIKAVKQTAEELYGRYSVCAYNKAEDRLFYFKNKQTAFDFRLLRFSDGSEVLLGSTASRNFNDVYMREYQIFYDPKYSAAFDAEAGHEVIYEILPDQIRVVESFEENKTYSSYYNYNNSTTNSSKPNRYQKTGGYYEQDWTEWDSQWANGKDIDYSHPKHAFAGIAEKGDLRFDIAESADYLWEEIQEALGFEFDHNIYLDNDKVIYTINDAPVSMNDICETLNDLSVCSPSIKDHNKIQVSVEHLYELFK